MTELTKHDVTVYDYRMPGERVEWLPQSDWMRLHIEAEVQAIDASPEPATWDSTFGITPAQVGLTVDDVAVTVWKLAQLTKAQLEAVAYQFAKADDDKANHFDDALACALGDVPDVHIWQAQSLSGLDEQQQRDLATELVRRDAKFALQFSATLADVLQSAADAAVNPANIVGVGPIIPVGPTPDSGSLYRYDEDLDDWE